MTRGRWLAVALVAATVVLVARAFAVAFVEYRWFAAFVPGGLDVWRARTVDLTLLRCAAAAVAGLFLYVNLLGVASTIDAVAVSRRLGGIEIAETVPAGRLKGVFALASAAFGLAMALPITNWIPLDAVLTGRTFGEIEPYTGRDLAFFVYWLPFENGVYAWTLVAVAFVTGAVVALYALTPGLRWARGRVRATVRVRRHLALFGVATLLLLAWGHRLDAYALLVDGSGPNGAFVGTDDLALLPTRFALAIVSALAAIVVLRAGWAGQARLAFWAVTAVVLTTIVGRSLAGPIASVTVAPARLAVANAAAAANRALYTRRAFAADQVRDASTGPASAASLRDAAANAAVWDAAALARLVAPTPDARAPRTYVGWQPVGDTIAAVLASARAPGDAATLGAAGRDAARPAWRATLVDPRTPGPLAVVARGAGDPGRIDVPGVIYPGAGEAAVVSDRGGRVVGDAFGPWAVRLATALAARDLRLLRVGDSDRGDVRLVRRRDPRERVQTLFPFFTVGRDATPVVAGDSVWWAVAVLAATPDYPLAEHLPLDGADGEDVASLRGAGTALVNAATGSVRLIAAPEQDADIRAWYARFPRIATRPEALDPALAAALPVPYDAALAQARVYAEFGGRGTRVPPARRVQLGESVDSSVARPGSAYVTATDARTPVIATTFPVISVADRVGGLVVATGGAAPRTTWVAAAGAGPRWQDVLDSTTSGSAPDASGPRGAPVPVFDGGVHAVPTAAGVLFTRAHYAPTADARPALAGVTAVIAERVARGASLRELFDSAGAGAAARPTRALTGDQRLGAARALYDDARRALQRGDWAAFGHALDAIGRVLAPLP